jgi:hypothetical protein
MLDEKTHDLLLLAEDFATDAEDLKDFMEERNKRMTFILAAVTIGGVGTCIVPVLTHFLA